MLEESVEHRDDFMDEELRRFWDRYPMDDRATRLLLGCSFRLQRQVIDTFDPKNKDEVDYSRQVTGYIRSLQADEFAGRKRGLEEEDPHGGMVGKRARLESDAPTAEDIDQFRSRYPIDSRAHEYLVTSAPAVQRQVLSEFSPKVENEPDYSSLVTSLVKKMRAVTGYTRSFHADELAGWKHGHQEEDPSRGMVGKRARLETDAPTAEDIDQFRSRYPIDSRAHEYLVTSAPAVQWQVLSEFRPKVENEPDYSSLVTSLVKKMRAAAGSGPNSSGVPAGNSVLGPSLESLKQFKDRFPMDQRAWDFLLSAPGHVQEVVVSEFKPKNPDDVNFSAAVTAFVRAMSNKPGMDKPSRAKLDLFRERYPMDERAFDYLSTAGIEVQTEVLQNFRPKNEDETDYSRPITAFVKLCLKNASKGPEVRGREPPWRSSDRSEPPRRGSIAHSSRSNEVRRDESKGDGKGGGLLRAFRARYPMDDRAYEYLQQAEPEVQQLFMAEFQPKRRGRDDDYSASVTSFLKVMREKVKSNSFHGNGIPSRGYDALLEGFRRRYPMDDRAFEYLCQQDDDVRRKVVDTFRPKSEGEADYSRLVTSVVKACKPR